MASMLSCISPLDGRYDAQLNELRPYLSEFGLIKHRVKIEILWFISLSENKKIKEVPSFSKTVIQHSRLSEAYVHIPTELIKHITPAGGVTIGQRYRCLACAK